MNILFVCTGNICRSPTAHAILETRIKTQHLNHYVDSAGIHGYHSGEPPDPRAIKVAAEHNVAMDHLIARQITANDYQKFDLILAMDHGHLWHLQGEAPADHQHKIALLLDHVGMGHNAEVADPYYGEMKDFTQMYQLLEEAIDKLLDNSNL